MAASANRDVPVRVTVTRARWGFVGALPADPCRDGGPPDAPDWVRVAQTCVRLPTTTVLEASTGLPLAACSKRSRDDCAAGQDHRRPRRVSWEALHQGYPNHGVAGPAGRREGKLGR